MPVDSIRLEAVVERFYEAAARPDLWRPVLHELALAADAQGAQMLYHRPAGAALHTVSQGLDEVSDAFFREGWHVDNPRELRARRRRVALHEVITDADLFTKEELNREPWQEHFLDRFGLRWFSSFSAIPFDEIAPVILTIERPARQSPFVPTEVAQLRSIVAHVQRAGQLSLAVAAAKGAGLLDGLDYAGQGAMLLNDLGLVVQINSAAERLLGDGCAMVNGRLIAANRTTNAQLQRLIGSITPTGRWLETPVPDAVAVPRRDRRPLIVQATPLVNAARDFFQQARALLVFIDLDKQAEPHALFLTAAFDLTPAEVRVAQAIVGGGNVAAVARRMALSPATVRTHLKAIFAKTGTHTQSSLSVLLDRMTRPQRI